MQNRAAVTTGGGAETDGRISLRGWGMIIALLMLSNTVNVTSALFVPAGQRHFDMWEIALWEGSSAIALILLAPVFYAAYARWPQDRLGWPRFIAIHLGLFLVFSLLHVTGMLALRKLVYAVMGRGYDFTHGKPLVTFLYEARKDFVTYLIFLLFFWVDRRRSAGAGAEVVEAAAAPVVMPERLEVRSDGRTLYLTPAEIVFIEAAGNYVEVHQASSAKPLLLRGTMAEYEEKLKGTGMVRVHRSRLVNRARIASFAATPSGDLRITLSDGRELAGSRRYRENL